MLCENQTVLCEPSYQFDQQLVAIGAALKQGRRAGNNERSSTVVDDRATTPNCLGSRIFKIADFKCLSEMNSSATFDKIGVSEIGRRCLLMLVICVSLGIGDILALFHIEGNFPWL